MANVRRGGRGKLPAQELRGTLGALFKTTIAQAGVVRDVIERGAREGRSRLDGALASRRRHDLLAKLGEVIFDLIRSGEIDLDELPEVRDLVARLDRQQGTGDSATAGRAAAAGTIHDRDAEDGTVSTRSAPWTSRGDDPDDGSDLSDYMHPGDVPPRDSR